MKEDGFWIYLFATASKSWITIATALKAIPKTYSQKFCTFIFLEGRFLIMASVYTPAKPLKRAMTIAIVQPGRDV
jgi:hypothetical protein